MVAKTLHLTITASGKQLCYTYLQVSYGLVGVVGIGRNFSKPLVCISTLPHHVAYVTQPHTKTYGEDAQRR